MLIDDIIVLILLNYVIYIYIINASYINILLNNNNKIMILR